MRHGYLIAALLVAVATAGCTGTRGLQPATMQDLDDQRADLQGEIDEAVENVQEAFDEVHDRVKAGIEAGEEPDEYLPEATDVEVGKVDHTQPRDGTLAMILDALLQFIIYAGGGTTLATMASRARRGMTMITGRPKPPKDPHAS